MMPIAPQPRRVVIIDDEAGVRDLLELVCASAELSSTSFASAEAFLAGRDTMQDGRTLILLDIDLPGIDGLTLLKRLKAERLDAPVIMISGAADIAKAKQAIKLGAADFFDKPFDVQVIRRRIRQLAHATW